MTMQAESLTEVGGSEQQCWATQLNSSETSPKEVLGIVREDYHPYFGWRKFIYGRFDASSFLGHGASFLDTVIPAPVVAATETQIESAGLTAGLYNGALLRVVNDSGAGGLAPAGETARIASNDATTFYIDPDDAFSVAPGPGDILEVIIPWAFQVSQVGDVAGKVAGVAMVEQDAGDYGWLQFEGLYPTGQMNVAGIATDGESVICSIGGLFINGGPAGPTENYIAYTRGNMVTGSNTSEVPLDLFTGKARQLATSV